MIRRAVDELASGLRWYGIRPGDRVIVALPNGISFYCMVVACIAMGAVAVPAPTPAVARTGAFKERITGICADCDPALLVSEHEWMESIERVLAGQCPTATYGSMRQLGGDPDDAPPPGSQPVALLQYTSGSTGRPRGVVITHDALRACCAQSAHAYAEHVDDLGVTWPPLYHNPGMLTGVMRPLFTGYPSVLLRPHDFVRDPGTWLEAIDACGGTLSSAPNFAYELCLRKVAAERVARLDLRSWRVARNAGEVVPSGTVDRFAEHFAAAGFGRDTMCPAYGLTEATLSVTTCTPRTRPIRLSVRRSDFQRGVVTPVSDVPAADGSLSLLSLGVPVAGTHVRVDGGRGRVGPVWIRGPQLAAGRWGGGDWTTVDGAAHWYETGDLGFIYGGQLFVVGRADDTVIYHGRNFYLSDVVAACAAVPQLQPGRMAAFVVRDERRGTEDVHLVAELKPGVEPGTEALDAVAVETRRRLASTLDLFVAEVIFVSHGELPATTSGKIRAAEVKRRFEDGRLPGPSLANP